MVIGDSIKDKFPKRKYGRGHIASNISLNIISASVLPQNVSWSDMEGFVSRKFGLFKFNFKNANDDIVAGMEFYVTYNCKGQYNSTGQYLTEVTISPNEIFANTGYELTCNVTASEPINYGTRANPIAGVVLKVQMQVKSHYKLKTDPLHSLENPIETKVLPNSDELVEEGTSTATNYSSIAKNSETIIPSSRVKDSEVINSLSRSHQTVNTVSSKLSHLYRNGFYVEEQFLNVIVRGDSQVSILSAYGY
jgi:hypothetical protein